MRKLAPWKVPFFCALATVAVPLTLAMIVREAGSFSAPAAAPVSSAPLTAQNGQPIDISLADAIGRNWINAKYQGNGHDELAVSLLNRFNAPLRLSFSSGLIFETLDFKAQVAIATRQLVEVPAGGKRETRLPVVATHLDNPLNRQVYHLCPDVIPALAPLFAEVDNTPEISRDAVQTAVLMLTDNAPLSAFAKFALLSSDAAKTTTTAYQVNNAEILAGFDLVHSAGFSRINLVATRDVQLKIESMIDPLSHAAALKYYKIAADKEWAYWKHELEAGDPSTRHYALYGIGRYYPEVALQMLPAWARARNLSPLYRTSALQAMAETRQPEAISVLQTLVGEFGAASDLGQSARKSIAYLENQRVAPAAATMLVDFRVSQSGLQ